MKLINYFFILMALVIQSYAHSQNDQIDKMQIINDSLFIYSSSGMCFTGSYKIHKDKIYINSDGRSILKEFGMECNPYTIPEIKQGDSIIIYTVIYNQNWTATYFYDTLDYKVNNSEFIHVFDFERKMLYPNDIKIPRDSSLIYHITYGKFPEVDIFISCPEAKMIEIILIKYEGTLDHSIDHYLPRKIKINKKKYKVRAPI